MNLTVETAIENFKKGDNIVNQVVDEKGDTILLLQKYTGDKFLVQFHKGGF